MDLGLDGARALVTGASRGIGRSIAHALASEGAGVAICARGASGLERAATELREVTGTVVAKALDVSVVDELRWFTEHAAATMGGLDIVVANVTGGGAPTPDQWERNFTSDLMPFVTLVDAALPYLRAAERGGAVVLISSTSALHVTPPSGPKAYGPMKAALNHYAAGLARTLAPEGIRVNTVSPGPVEFDGGGWAIRREREPDYYRWVRERIPYGRLGRPEEVARAVSYLASPAATFVTGANLVVDGGFLDRV